MNQPNAQPETDPTEGVLSRVWERPSDIVKAIDSTNLKKYPWGDISPGLQWHEARFFLFMMLFNVRMHCKRFNDDECVMDMLKSTLPDLRSKYVDLQQLSKKEDPGSWLIDQFVEVEQEVEAFRDE